MATLGAERECECETERYTCILPFACVVWVILYEYNVCVSGTVFLCKSNSSQSQIIILKTEKEAWR
jgi:hypothetical protein